MDSTEIGIERRTETGIEIGIEAWGRERDWDRDWDRNRDRDRDWDRNRERDWDRDRGRGGSGHRRSHSPSDMYRQGSVPSSAPSS